MLTALIYNQLLAWEESSNSLIDSFNADSDSCTQLYYKCKELNDCNQM
jgi:hypothetical protein